MLMLMFELIITMAFFVRGAGLNREGRRDYSLIGEG